jgi:hypothetical protein
LDGVQVEVAIRAESVGHRVPTGFADRNLMLVLEAFRKDGSRVPPAEESVRLPSWAGRKYTGLAGKLYAKQLGDFDGRHPVPFWRARPEVQDNRLRPGQADCFACRFPRDVVRVRWRLLYRRFWPEVAEAKQWPEEEVVVVEQVGDVISGASARESPWTKSTPQFRLK